jgi:hypothetical protein
MINRVFVCEDCGREISLCGPESYTADVCVICNWLRDPTNNLTEIEKLKLRAQLAGPPYTTKGLQ